MILVMGGLSHLQPEISHGGSDSMWEQMLHGIARKQKKYVAKDAARKKICMCAHVKHICGISVRVVNCITA